MKIKILSSSILLITCLGIIFCTRQDVQASVKLMDGNLILSGFVKETFYYRTAMYDREKPYHDNRMDFLQTSGLFEALYTLRDDEDFGIRVFAGFKYWLQKAQYFDEQYDRTLSRNEKYKWAHPRSFEDDVLTEAYVDITTGPWKIRVGKQIVIWGQLDLERVADVVNPLDISRGPPGINTWEEVKKGLWMIRLFYQSDLPGNLLFEVIFNPGDYETFEGPYEGTPMGALAFESRYPDPGQKKEIGMYSYIREKWMRDAPGWNLKDNYEFGFRIRGNTFDIDWTLLYWNARDDGPVLDPDTNLNFLLAYGVTPYDRGSWDWTDGVGNEVTDSLGGFDPSTRVFHFKRYETIGGTAQYYSHKLWDTVWRLEWFYEIDRPLNRAIEGHNIITGWTRKDILGVAIQCNKKWKIPWFTKNVVKNLMLESNITYGWEKVFNHDHDLVLASRNYYWKNSSNDVVTLFMMQGLRDMSFVFVFTGNYFLRTGKWQAIPVISYVFPGIHWRADIGYVAYGGAKKEWVKSAGSVESSDLLFLRLRYEF